jgi:hypothetical protein
MYYLQRSLQSKINGYEVSAQTDEQRIENIRLNVLALTSELHELLNETGWKPWATSRHINYDRARAELIDAWHFMMNLMLHLRMTSGDLYVGYKTKHLENVRRQNDGYDGVAGKCPACHRDLQEDPPKAVQATSALIPRTDFHCVCGQWLFARTV